MERTLSICVIFKLTIIVAVWMVDLMNICSASFTNTWAVHIEGGHRKARSLAEKHGFVYEGEIIEDYYLFRHARLEKRSVESSPHLHKSLSEETDVKWLEQQYAKKRVKREIKLNDPMYPKMWYLNRGSCKDMNIRRAWEMGYTGRGSVVTILDDGIEKNHPDLKQNYDPDASYDINEHDSDPQPRYDIFNYNRHGTRCAGEVAATANNSQCSVGIAYNAGIGGIRMLDGDITDAVEAASIGFNQGHIEIYSASWGPDDDGKTVDGPGRLAKEAFERGVKTGRGGKGNIFVWASGNGGRQGDSCSCDGYTNSIYTLSVSSATERGTIPWYSEPCASTLCTTYSSGSGSDRMIMTTDLRLKCTDRHTGTSASAPLAAGIVAVVLEANRELTWRDMQHIVVRTAQPAHLLTTDWVTNGVGLKVSHSFGFGLMDTAGMVDMARNWTRVPDKLICSVDSPEHEVQIPPNTPKKFSVTYTGCKNPAERVNYLEHVQAKVTLATSRRGAISIYLTSPKGTRSTLLPKRMRDYDRKGFDGWEFLSTHTWGESPDGVWELEINSGPVGATLHSWSLIVHGTKDLPGPGPYQNKPNNCNSAYGGAGKNVAPPVSGGSGHQKGGGGKRYYEPCDPSALECGPNMVCGPSPETGSVTVCQCLPSLKYNGNKQTCDDLRPQVQSIIAGKDQVLRSIPHQEDLASNTAGQQGGSRLTQPIYLVIAGVVMFVLLVVLVGFAVYRYKRRNTAAYQRVSTSDSVTMGTFNPDLSQVPAYTSRM